MVVQKASDTANEDPPTPTREARQSALGAGHHLLSGARLNFVVFRRARRKLAGIRRDSDEFHHGRSPAVLNIQPANASRGFQATLGSVAKTGHSRFRGKNFRTHEKSFSVRPVLRSLFSFFFRHANRKRRLFFQFRPFTVTTRDALILAVLE